MYVSKVFMLTIMTPSHVCDVGAYVDILIKTKIGWGIVDWIISQQRLRPWIRLGEKKGLMKYLTDDQCFRLLKFKMSMRDSRWLWWL